jgi:mRNA-degrading endonuclease RelE of RelBE toxin-antitoxin system
MTGDMAGYYRIRVIVLGIRFRVVYSVEDAVEVVEVIRIGSREDIY